MPCTVNKRLAIKICSASMLSLPLTTTFFIPFTLHVLHQEAAVLVTLILLGCILVWSIGLLQSFRAQTLVLILLCASVTVISAFFKV